MVSKTAFQQSHLREAPLHAVLHSTWSLFMASARASGYVASRVSSSRRDDLCQIKLAREPLARSRCAVTSSRVCKTLKVVQQQVRAPTHFPL